MSITLAEIAAKAGVTHGIVSLVLRDKAKTRVSQNKQQLIRELAHQYNYRPNMAARGLRKQKQYTIGIIMPSLLSRFYGEMASRIQHRLTQEGYMGIFAFWESLEEVEKTYDTIFSRGVDGIITWEYHECLKTEKIPAVVYEALIPGYDCVRSDNELFARQAVSYLFRLGHRRIGYIGGHADRRYKYYLEALTHHGLPVNPEWTLNCRCTLDDGAKGITHVLSAKSGLPTAIITQNDTIAMGAMYEAITSGLRVPEDISFIGSDDLPEAAYYLPPLTTFGIKLDLLAKSLVDLMLKRLVDPELPQSEIVIPPELIIRKSCAEIK